MIALDNIVTDNVPKSINCHLLFNCQKLPCFIYTYTPTIHCYSSDDLGQKLFEASHKGHVDEVKRLLAKGAPVNWGDSIGRTALHTACWHNKPPIVKILKQQNGINVNVQTNGKNTPLHYACDRGYWECFQLLIATEKCDLGKSVCVSCRNYFDWPIIMSNCTKNTFEM